jgi:hypothetical protein
MTNPQQALDFTRGQFFIAAASTHFELPHSAMAEAYEKFMTPIVVPGTKFHSYSPRPSPEASVSDLAPIMVRMHELAHYRSTMSTPFGLFLFRLTVLTSSTMQYVCRRIKVEIGGEYEVAWPFKAWFLENGHRLISPSTMLAPGYPLMYHLGNKLLEAEAYNDFSSTLLFKGKTTVGSLCNQWNSILGLIKIQHELEAIPTITSRLSPDLEPANIDEFSILSLFEAIARLDEIRLLHSFGLSSEKVEDWARGVFHKEYGAVLSYVFEACDYDVRKTAVLLDWTLLGPADPMFAEEEHLIEEVHPILRLSALLSESEDLPSEAFNDENLSETMHKIFLSLGWTSIDRLSELGGSRPFIGKKAWDETVRVYRLPEGTENIMDRMYADVRAQCLLGLSRRKDDRGLFGLGVVPMVYQPAIEYYSNRAVIHSNNSREQATYQYYFSLLSNLFSEAIIGNDAELLPLIANIARAFRATFEPAAGGKYDHVISPSAILEGSHGIVLPQDLSALLGSWKE